MQHNSSIIKQTESSAQPDRLFYLDWLRVLAILVVFLYHSTRFFNLGDWHMKNLTTYAWVEIWNIFSMTWLMPLFFIISGASLFYAIGKSGKFSKFYSSKFLRLMVPVMVAAVTHSALQVYIERHSHGQFPGSFLSFIPEYFSGLYFGIGAPMGNYSFFGMHLWYLVFLFVDSLICYRLFLWFKGNGSRVLNGITSVFSIPGLIYIGFSIPLIIMYAITPPAVLNAGAGAWGFLYYLWFLIAGFMIVSSKKVQQTIMNQRWISLVIGVVLSAIFITHRFNPSFMMFPASIDHWIYKCIYYFSAGSWLFAIFGFGMRRLTSDRPFLVKANEGVLPFYILHQPVLVCIGFFVMQWEIHDLLKWIIVFTGSFAVIITLYLSLVRRFDFIRFLFGMKTTRPFFDIFRKKTLHAAMITLYTGLIVFAVSGVSVDRSPMPLTYDPSKDIVLNSKSISSKSSAGVQIVHDNDASMGQAIEFSSGANMKAKPRPDVYVEVRFSAPEGLYNIWLRGKCDSDGYADSVWLQVDDQIGTQTKSIRAGNWIDVHPAGAYGWAGDSENPVTIKLMHNGEHTIRIQPRQSPHRIDQILLSQSQHRIPNTFQPIKGE